MDENLSITNKTKGKLPRLPFLDLKNDILGKKYVLSIALVGEATSKKINNQYRQKNKPTNVLSFALSKNEGELVICPSVIKKQIKKFDRSFDELFGFLVIHGMLHLIGHEHSSKIGEARMEREENKYDQKYFYRNRRRLGYDQSRSGRVFKGRK
jgi:probable rRNA maturation factor